MFTGLITDMGHVRAIGGDGDKRIEFTTRYDTDAIAVGASICCAGVCMTVIDKGAGWFATSATAETLSRTTLGGWEAGTPVNLEQALKAGDPLGGHMVLGHVDGVARVAEVVPDGESLGLAIAAPDHLMRYIAAKGSVAVDGVSLTVNEIVEDRFAVTVIPHTRAVTTLGALEAGRAVNLEIDMVARYVARLLGKE